MYPRSSLSSWDWDVAILVLKMTAQTTVNCKKAQIEYPAPTEMSTIPNYLDSGSNNTAAIESHVKVFYNPSIIGIADGILLRR